MLNSAEAAGSLGDDRLFSQDINQNNSINRTFSAFPAVFSIYYTHTLVKWDYYLSHVRILNTKFGIVRPQSPNNPYVLVNHVRGLKLFLASTQKRLHMKWRLP